MIICNHVYIYIYDICKRSFALVLVTGKHDSTGHPSEKRAGSPFPGPSPKTMSLGWEDSFPNLTIFRFTWGLLENTGQFIYIHVYIYPSIHLKWINFASRFSEGYGFYPIVLVSRGYPAILGFFASHFVKSRRKPAILRQQLWRPPLGWSNARGIPP